MEVLDKKEYLNQLFDLYGILLTDRQQLMFSHYYQEDYTLQEIAELYTVSRNAVFDTLKKVEDHLVDFEEKLKLLKRKLDRQKLYDRLEETHDLSLVDALRKLD